MKENYIVHISDDIDEYLVIERLISSIEGWEFIKINNLPSFAMISFPCQHDNEIMLNLLTNYNILMWPDFNRQDEEGINLPLFLTQPKIFDIIYIENNKERSRELNMTAEVLKALAVILELCHNQDSCHDCPLSSFCGKMPCEW